MKKIFLKYPIFTLIAFLMLSGTASAQSDSQKLNDIISNYSSKMEYRTMSLDDSTYTYALIQRSWLGGSKFLVYLTPDLVLEGNTSSDTCRLLVKTGEEYLIEGDTKYFYEYLDRKPSNLEYDRAIFLITHNSESFYFKKLDVLSY